MALTAAQKRARAKKMNERKRTFKIALGSALAILAVLELFSIFNGPSNANAPQTMASQSILTQVYEDDSSGDWDCRSDGNHVCGPGNSNHVRAGYYSYGNLVITWRQLKDWGLWNYGPPANADDGFH